MSRILPMGDLLVDMRAKIIREGLDQEEIGVKRKKCSRKIRPVELNGAVIFRHGGSRLARVGRNKRSALRRIVFDPSGSDMAKVPAAVRRVTASPNAPYISFPEAIGCL